VLPVIGSCASVFPQRLVLPLVYLLPRLDGQILVIARSADAAFALAAAIEAAVPGRPVGITSSSSAACDRAGIVPPANFHCVRHTAASLTIMGGAPLMVVAINLGHADTRMVERHYAHLAPSFVADAIRAAAPRFGMPVSGTVLPLSRHSKRGAFPAESE
jgi:integrase